MLPIIHLPTLLLLDFLLSYFLFSVWMLSRALYIYRAIIKPKYVVLSISNLQLGVLLLILAWYSKQSAQISHCSRCLS